MAALAGITVRTLHHYDALGLLKPSRTGDNGYRYYGDEAVLLLQQILFYRELGMELDTIKTLMGKPEFSVVRALESHRKALVKRIARLQKLVETVEKTVAKTKGETEMTDEELFAGLEAQEKAYAYEALDRWDPQVVRESQRRYNHLTPEQKKQRKADGDQFHRDWAVLIGTDPAGPAAQAMVARWRKSIEFFWTPELNQLVPMAEMYSTDERFKTTYDKADPRLAEYVLACVQAYVRLV